jgi:hypothetical protein
MNPIEAFHGRNTNQMTRRPYTKPQFTRLGLLRTLTRFSCPPGAWGDGCVVSTTK